MDKRIRYSLTGLCALFVFSTGHAQPNAQARVERWNDMWMTVTNYGYFSGCELPGGSGEQYMDGAALWIGAKILEQGFDTPRVSVAADGWLSPSINELWPPLNSTIIERSRLDTVNEFGQPIYSPQAVADHEFECTYTDTLTSAIYVHDDPIDGAHRPLGIKVTQTTYAMLAPECRHILWVKYHLQNIGNNFLKNPCLGFLVQGGVTTQTEGYQGEDDDIRGCVESEQVAYVADNDGRPANVDSGNVFTVPNVLGICALASANYFQQWPSFNWWVSNGDVTYDFGPSWQTASAWTDTFGTPMGDAHKYELLTNGEHDFDQVYAANWPWIHIRPQELPNGDAMYWRMPNTPQDWDIANGYYSRLLFSVRKVGIRDYQDQAGNWIYRLNPGESCDVWLAFVGGMNFHDPSNPQLPDTVLNPQLYNLSDFVSRVQRARAGMCLDWASVGEHLPHVAPAAFALDPAYPNPFNAGTRLRFSLQREDHVDIAAFDILGREAAHIASGNFAAGSHDVLWDAHELTSGLYFIRAQQQNGRWFVQKVVLLK